MTFPRPLKFEKKSRDRETIFLNHYDWLLDWARQHTQGASEEAGDLVQDLYVRFVQMKSGPSFTDKELENSVSPERAARDSLSMPLFMHGQENNSDAIECWHDISTY